MSDVYDEMSFTQLKGALLSRGQPRGGSADDLRARLRNGDGAEPEAEMHMHSADEHEQNSSGSEEDDEGEGGGGGGEGADVTGEQNGGGGGQENGGGGGGGGGGPGADDFEPALYPSGWSYRVDQENLPGPDGFGDVRELTYAQLALGARGYSSDDVLAATGVRCNLDGTFEAAQGAHAHRTLLPDFLATELVWTVTATNGQLTATPTARAWYDHHCIDVASAEYQLVSIYMRGMFPNLPAFDYFGVKLANTWAGGPATVVAADGTERSTAANGIDTVTKHAATARWFPGSHSSIQPNSKKGTLLAHLARLAVIAQDVHYGPPTTVEAAEVLFTPVDIQYHLAVASALFGLDERVAPAAIQFHLMEQMEHLPLHAVKFLCGRRRQAPTPYAYYVAVASNGGEWFYQVVRDPEAEYLRRTGKRYVALGDGGLCDHKEIRSAAESEALASGAANNHVPAPAKAADGFTLATAVAAAFDTVEAASAEEIVATCDAERLASAAAAWAVYTADMAANGMPVATPQPVATPAKAAPPTPTVDEICATACSMRNATTSVVRVCQALYQPRSKDAAGVRTALQGLAGHGDEELDRTVQMLCLLYVDVSKAATNGPASTASPDAIHDAIVARLASCVCEGVLQSASSSTPASAVHVPDAGAGAGGGGAGARPPPTPARRRGDVEFVEAKHFERASFAIMPGAPFKIASEWDAKVTKYNWNNDSASSNGTDYLLNVVIRFFTNSRQRGDGGAGQVLDEEDITEAFKGVTLANADVLPVSGPLANDSGAMLLNPAVVVGCHSGAARAQFNSWNPTRAANLKNGGKGNGYGKGSSGPAHGGGGWSGGQKGAGSGATKDDISATQLHSSQRLIEYFITGDGTDGGYNGRTRQALKEIAREAKASGDTTKAAAATEFRQGLLASTRALGDYDVQLYGRRADRLVQAVLTSDGVTHAKADSERKDKKAKPAPTPEPQLQRALNLSFH